jgi:hypothetical protein
MVHSVDIQESGAVRMAVIADSYTVHGEATGQCALVRGGGRGGGHGATAVGDGVIDLRGCEEGDPAHPSWKMTVAQRCDSLEWDAEAPPSTADAFTGWNFGAVPMTADVVGDAVGRRCEKYELPMLPSAAVGRGGGACSPIGQIARYLGNGVWRARNRGNEWRPGRPGGRARRRRDALSGRMNG